VLAPRQLKGNLAMPRPPHPASIETSPAAAGFAQAVEKQLGVVPNLFRLVGTSPPPRRISRLRRRAGKKASSTPRPAGAIALAVAQNNGCDYCLSGAYLSRQESRKSCRKLKWQPSRWGSTDPKAAAAVRFATEM